MPVRFRAIDGDDVPVADTLPDPRGGGIQGRHVAVDGHVDDPPSVADVQDRVQPREPGTHVAAGHDGEANDAVPGGPAGPRDGVEARLCLYPNSLRNN